MIPAIRKIIQTSEANMPDKVLLVTVAASNRNAGAKCKHRLNR